MEDEDIDGFVFGRIILIFIRSVQVSTFLLRLKYIVLIVSGTYRGVEVNTRTVRLLPITTVYYKGTKANIKSLLLNK